jgi:hypothetical protein
MKKRERKLTRKTAIESLLEEAPKRYILTCMVGGWCGSLEPENYIDGDTRPKAAKNAETDGWVYGIAGDSEGLICPNCKDHLQTEPEEGCELTILYPKK